ncbi:DNA mismatch repair protein MutS [Spirochaeta cellobiosiphila]|uniref:DNA mismatch repair protein MutS n=1 Tax=Spirochaeta cellobiosiphila TaxID=504483 RepID=UPI000411A6D5|nr:DNA mismatch repair protein MutS [Spirochaeta cellobiosiphila]
MSETTPMMKQYQDIKKKNKDSILFFRLGDFYEMFRDDAVEVSSLLNLTLTKRHNIPMCGIPYHAAEGYIGRLLKYGKKIAICEQVSMPTDGKGIAKREIVEVITPGTITNENYLNQKENNYIVVIGYFSTSLSLAFADLSTGEFQSTSFRIEDGLEVLRKELQRINPSEVIVQDNINEIFPGINALLSSRPNLVINRYPDWQFDKESCYKTLIEHFSIINLKAFNLNESSPEVISAGVLISYLEDTSKSHLRHIRTLKTYSHHQFLVMDDSTQRNLELIRNLTTGDQAFTLLKVLDQTKTAMGGRLLKKWILSPLIDQSEIEKRHDNVQYFYQHQLLLSKIRDQLSKIQDIERLTTRVAMDKAHGKDLLALSNSLINIRSCEPTLEEYNKYINFWTNDEANVKKIDSLGALLSNSIHPEPSILTTEGRLIKEGYSSEVDELRQLQNNAKVVLNNYLSEQKLESGITGLKLKYNKILGYFFEVTNSNLQAVPEHFERRQQLVNAERYVTSRLKELENNIHNAGERLIELEKKLFYEIREKCKDCIDILQQISQSIGEVDYFQSMAYIATRRGYIRPEITNSRTLNIDGGRHPVVEEALPSNEFIPNGISLDPDKKSFAMITGPNMAGKSTFLRQIALISIMAQIGSFVPASKAQIGIIDKIFCRVGASDNLAKGESTFLVEMSETAHILRNSTNHSLIIMDEVGRGTSTNDGLSIAWAICEYIIDKIDAKSLFATHYHELTLLKSKKIQNLSMDVKETGEDIVFLKKIKKGPAGNSYGIHVAKLAGIPLEVVYRATQILNEIGDTDSKINIPDKNNSGIQSGLFSPEELISKELAGMNLNNMTPIQALNLLHRWKNEHNL